MDGPGTKVEQKGHHRLLVFRSNVLWVVAVCDWVYRLLSWLSPNEELKKAWVEYPFEVGAILFLISNYLVYFQVINEKNEVNRMHFFEWPRCERAHIGCLLNIAGAVFYLIGCTVPFFVDCSSNLAGNTWKVLPGSIGSICFTMAAICQGEYNNWRKCDRQTLLSLPVWASWCSLGGAVTFFVGYSVGWNHMSYTDPRAMTIYGVFYPWVFGSFCFLACGHLELFMWKQRMYGLGWSTHLSPGESLQEGEGDTYVDASQQCMIFAYIMLICSSFVDIGVQVAVPVLEDHFSTFRIGENIKTLGIYTIVMLLASVLHTTPPVQPYSSLLWCMRAAAVWDFVWHIYYWKELVVIDLGHFYN